MIELSPSFIHSDAMTEPLAAFIEAACVPLDSDHATGTLEAAEAVLAAHPDVATANIHAAAILGDAATVRRFLELDRANATVKSGPRGWDALTHLCFSRYLRLDRERSDGFLRAATALLDAGANANTGWYEANHQPSPEWESALYGAAGVAHHAELTRLLLERGADPNDGETPYHTPETYDNAAMKVLVESGKQKSTRLNSSHTVISYAVFCLKKKKKKKKNRIKNRKERMKEEKHTEV